MSERERESDGSGNMPGTFLMSAVFYFLIMHCVYFVSLQFDVLWFKHSMYMHCEALSCLVMH